MKTGRGWAVQVKDVLYNWALETKQDVINEGWIDDKYQIVRVRILKESDYRKLIKAQKDLEDINSGLETKLHQGTASTTFADYRKQVKRATLNIPPSSEALAEAKRRAAKEIKPMAKAIKAFVSGKLVKNQKEQAK